MKKLIVYLACLFTLPFLGCASNVPLQREQLARISRDTLPLDLEKILASATPTSLFTINITDKDYYVRSYHLQTGSRPEVMVICTPTCMVIPTQVPIMTDYSIIQLLPAKSMFAWGTLEELSKDPDPAVSSIMPAIKDRIASAIEGKNK